MAINRTRNKSVTFRMTDAELELFKSKFEQSQVKNQTDFLLGIVSGTKIVVNNELVPLLAELKRQGNNLNQVARALNEGSITEQGAQQVLRVLRECHAAYRKLLAAKLGE